MVEITNLTKTIKDKTILSNVTLSIPSGSIYGLIGKSGAGKSTLLRCVNGLDRFDSGEILVEGTSVSGLHGKNLLNFRKNVGMVFQDFALLQRLTAIDNVALPMRCWHFPKAEIKKRAKELLDIVGIASRSTHYPSQLSGGEKQRVAIARALTLNPRVLLCDEVTSALDPQNAQAIVNLLKDLNREFGLTIIMVSHQLSVIKQACKYTALMDGGKIVLDGETDNLFMNHRDTLTHLIGDEHIDLREGSVLKISISDREMSAPILSTLAKDCQVDFILNGTQYETYFDKRYFTYYISANAEDAKSIIAWLKGKNIQYEILRNENV